MSGRFIAVASMAAVIGACSAQSSTGAPRLAIKYDGTTNPFNDSSYGLMWTPPLGDVSSYDIETRVPPDTFRLLESVDYKSRGIGRFFDASVPEAADVEFRVRALPDADGSRVSNVVRVHRVIHAPILSCANPCSPADGGVHLQWTTQSTVTESYVLERSWRLLTEGVATQHPLPTVELPGSATSYVDQDTASWTDGATILYTLHAVTGGERSASTVAGTLFALPLEPSVSAALLPGGGVRISYENHSRVATSLDIHADGSWSTTVPAPAPGGSGTYDYHSTLLPGLRRFWVTLETPFGPTDISASAYVLFLETQPVNVSAQAAVLPPGSLVARTPSGWATAAIRPWNDNSPQPPFATVASDAGRAVLSTPAGSTIVRQGLAADPNGRVHLVYTEPVSGTSSLFAIVHAWADGLSWSREEIARRAFAAHAKIDVALDGTLLVSWASSTTVEIATQTAGGWVIEDVTAALGSALPLQGGVANQFLAGDESGNPHLFVVDQPPFGSNHGFHVFRDAGGWNVEARGQSYDTADDDIALLCGSGRVLVARRSFSPFGPMLVSERTATGWSDATIAQDTGVVVDFAAARSADGTLFAIAVQSTRDRQPNELWVSDGTWRRAADFGYIGDGLGVGFKADDKAWVISGLAEPSGGTGDVGTALYEQL